MRLCPNGHENPDEAKFCNECAAPIPAPASGAGEGADQAPPSPPKPSPQHIDKRALGIVLVLVGCLAVVGILVGVLASRGRPSSETAASEGGQSNPSPTESAFAFPTTYAPNTPEVVYAEIRVSVTGNYTGKVDVTWRDADGSHTQVVNNPTFWTKEVPVDPYGTDVYLHAVARSIFVSPRCSITSGFGEQFSHGQPELKHGHWECHAGPVTLST